MALFPNHEFPEYLMLLQGNIDAGMMDDYPDPSLPSDLGSPLTQDEIDLLKKICKEVRERFNGS
jgi:hypothetical protein